MVVEFPNIVDRELDECSYNRYKVLGVIIESRRPPVIVAASCSLLAEQGFTVYDIGCMIASYQDDITH